MINGKNMNNIFNQKTKDGKDIFIKTNNNSKNIYMKPKERMYQYPQVINNYDVNVKVNIKKLNDNNINIGNMNISELLNKKLGCNNKRNKSILDDKNNYFSKTDNNIKFLDSNIIKPITKKENLYNNMIQDLKNEFREIKQKHEMSKENKNIIKENKSKNIRNYLFNENKINKNSEKYNNYERKNNLNNNSVNNSYNKKINNKALNENILQGKIKENNIDNIDNIFINKNRTQNNFYKISDNNNYINFENEKSKIKEQVKSKEKLQKNNNHNNQNLQKAIIYMNNKISKNKEKKYMNLTNEFINDNIKINDDNSFINYKDDFEDVDLALYNNFYIKKKKSLQNNLQSNSIINNYISNLDKSKSNINKCNSYISSKNISIFDKNNTFINRDLEIGNKDESGKINNNKNTKVSTYKNNHDPEKVNKKNHKLLYLDKRINQIKNKMINKKYNNDINQTEIKNMDMEKVCSFSFIKKKIKKDNEISELNLNIINKIYKVQNNIILELKQKQFILKNELIKKYKEIQNYKNICFKLMFYIKDYLFNKKEDKKLQIIQNQIIKENFILRKLFFNKSVNNTMNNLNNPIKFMSDLNRKKIFYNTFNKFKDKNNSGQTSDCGRMNTSENNNEQKKRNKSFERINDKYILNQNSKKINDSSFKYINFREKKSKYIGESNDISVRSTKKIKYLTKDKNNLSLTFKNIGNNSNNEQSI